MLKCSEYLQVFQGQDAFAKVYIPDVPTNYLTCRHSLRPIATEDPSKLATLTDPVLGPVAVTQTITDGTQSYFVPVWSDAETRPLEVGDYDWVIELRSIDGQVVPGLRTPDVIRLVVKPEAMAAS